MSVYQSDISDLFIKSIERPYDLTSSEVVKLDAYFTALMSLYGRQWSMFREYDLAYDPTVDTVFAAESYFGGSFARAWFRENEVWLKETNPEMTKILSREIESNPLQSEYGAAERLKSIN